MVYEVVEYHVYRTCQEFGQDKASTAKRIQEAKVRVALHHITEGDKIGTNIFIMGFSLDI
jgi:hypothetical protein